MNIKLFQIDAFTDSVFFGNPAAVCPLESWLDENVMQAIAAENNLSETAFFVDQGKVYGLRWFTPTCEVDLCGHATLATSHLLFTRLATDKTELSFETRSGRLTVTRDGDLLVMDFPARVPSPGTAMPGLGAAMGREPDEVFASLEDDLLVYESEAAVRNLSPDMGALAKVSRRGVIATAPGSDSDFVSRFFAPAYGIPEDPVTGSAHCALVPYWSKRLGKTELLAHQVSSRGGTLICRAKGDRVGLAGRAVLYLEGSISI